MFLLAVLVLCFGGLSFCEVSLLAGDKPMSPQFRKVHRPPLAVANYQQTSITSVLSKVFECLVSVHLGRFMERSSQTRQFAYRKGLFT